MSEKADALSDDAFEDMADLARSRNRVELLEAIAADPRSPRDIAAATGSNRRSSAFSRN